MGIFSGILSLLTGGVSNVITSGNLGNVLNNAGDTAVDVGTQNLLGNYTAKMTGSRLTDAEKASNAFNAEQANLAWQREQRSADIAWQRELEASNTQYQRRVADLQAAGINPLMAASSGGAAIPSAATASSSAASSVSPSGAGLNLGSLLDFALQMKLLPAQIANLRAGAAASQATANKANAEADTTRQQYDYFESVKSWRAESERLSNSLTRSQISHVDKSLDEIDARVHKMAEEAKTEESKRDYNRAASLLARASAHQIVELLPYERAYKEASTESARSAALLSAAETAYKNGLINDGYLDSLISSAKAKASSDTSAAELDAIRAAIRTGDYSNVKHRYGIANDVLSSIAILLDNFNPLNGLFK